MLSPSDSRAASSQSSQIAACDDSCSYSLYGLNDSCDRLPDTSPGLNPWSFCPPARELRYLIPSASTESEPSWKAISHDQREAFANFSWLAEDLREDNLVNVAGPPISGATSPRFCDFKACSEVGLSIRDSQDDLPDVCAATFPLSSPRDELAWAQTMVELDKFEGFCRSDEPQREQSKSERQMSPTTSSAELRLEEVYHSQTPIDSASLSSSFLSDSKTSFKGRKRKSDTCGDFAATISAENKEQERSSEKESGEANVHNEGDAGSDKQETKQPIARFFCGNPPRKEKCVKREREPRFAIKTKTHTDVMDDGYKWRKYGQKPVKSSPHPRNYYRCTTPNCPVRKRVERSTEDPDQVITTYEGRHTHQSPSFLKGSPEYPSELSGLLGALYHHYSLACNQAVRAHIPNFGDFGLSDLLFTPQGFSSNQNNLNVLRAHEMLKLQQEAACASILIKLLQFGAHNCTGRHQEGGPTNFPCPNLSSVNPSSNQSPLFDWLSPTLEQLGRLLLPNA